VPNPTVRVSSSRVGSPSSGVVIVTRHISMEYVTVGISRYLTFVVNNSISVNKKSMTPAGNNNISHGVAFANPERRIEISDHPHDTMQ
jgi:hypothetical protein